MRTPRRMIAGARVDDRFGAGDYVRGGPPGVGTAAGAPVPGIEAAPTATGGRAAREP